MHAIALRISIPQFVLAVRIEDAELHAEVEQGVADPGGLVLAGACAFEEVLEHVSVVHLDGLAVGAFGVGGLGDLDDEVGDLGEGEVGASLDLALGGGGLVAALEHECEVAGGAHAGVELALDGLGEEEVVAVLEVLADGRGAVGDAAAVGDVEVHVDVDDLVGARVAVQRALRQRGHHGQSGVEHAEERHGRPHARHHPAQVVDAGHGVGHRLAGVVDLQHAELHVHALLRARLAALLPVRRRLDVQRRHRHRAVHDARAGRAAAFPRRPHHVRPAGGDGQVGVGAFGPARGIARVVEVNERQGLCVIVGVGLHGIQHQFVGVVELVVRLGEHPRHAHLVGHVAVHKVGVVGAWSARHEAGGRVRLVVVRAQRRVQDGGAQPVGQALHLHGARGPQVAPHAREQAAPERPVVPALEHPARHARTQRGVSVHAVLLGVEVVHLGLAFVHVC